MTIIPSLETLSLPHIWTDHQPIIFRGSKYSPLFISLLLRKAYDEGYLAQAAHFIDLYDQEQSLIFEKLSQSFLGQRVTYWCGDITALVRDIRLKGIKDLLNNYDGLHKLILYEDEASPRARTTGHYIELPVHINSTSLQALFNFFNKGHLKRKLDIIDHERNRKPSYKLSLDATCLLINYLELINPRQGEQYHSIFDSLEHEENALFLLSSYFFAKKGDDFFLLWNSLSSDYSEMFWISFWSEQLFKAYYVTQGLRNNNITQVRAFNTRLPFSLTKTLWKNVDLDELAVALSFLYACDYKYKAGVSETGIEGLFFNYFSGVFKKQGALCRKSFQAFKSL